MTSLPKLNNYPSCLNIVIGVASKMHCDYKAKSVLSLTF